MEDKSFEALDSSGSVREEEEDVGSIKSVGFFMKRLSCQDHLTSQ